jgi:hypothetical protein
VNFERRSTIFDSTVAEFLSQRKCLVGELLDLEQERILLGVLNTPKKVVCSSYGGQYVS